MTNTAIALYNFFSGFGLPAYVEYSPPDEAELPYITYQLAEPNWRDPTPLYARVWYRSTSYAAINAKVDEIRAAFFQDGADNCVSIPTSGGAIYLSDFNAQVMPMEGDDTLKCQYLTMMLTAHTT